MVHQAHHGQRVCNGHPDFLSVLIDDDVAGEQKAGLQVGVKGTMRRRWITYAQDDVAAVCSIMVRYPPVSQYTLAVYGYIIV